MDVRDRNMRVPVVSDGLQERPHSDVTQSDAEAAANLPMLGWGGVIHRVYNASALLGDGERQSSGVQADGSPIWRGAPRKRRARIEPRPVVRVPRLPAPMPTPTAASPSALPPELQAVPQAPRQGARLASRVRFAHVADEAQVAFPGRLPAPESAPPALPPAQLAAPRQDASPVLPPSIDEEREADVRMGCATSYAPGLLPSFALQDFVDPERALPIISAPLTQVSSSAEARVTGHKAFPVHHSVFASATQQSHAVLEYRLHTEPDALTLWHPEGFNLLHHVVRQDSLEHVQVVLRAVQSLPQALRITILDGVAQDGLDAVRIAIDHKATVVLCKLLEAGCDPTRRRYRSKPLWFARLAQPLAPYSRIEDASLYAMRKRNKEAVDLLLLWDEARVLHLPESRFAFDLEELMAIAMSLDDCALRDGMVDVLHAARRRRPVAYLA